MKTRDSCRGEDFRPLRLLTLPAIPPRHAKKLQRKEMPFQVFKFRLRERNIWIEKLDSELRFFSLAKFNEGKFAAKKYFLCKFSTVTDWVSITAPFVLLLKFNKPKSCINLYSMFLSRLNGWRNCQSYCLRQWETLSRFLPSRQFFLSSNFQGKHSLWPVASTPEKP